MRRAVPGGNCGDLLSWVMGRAGSGSAWITVMGNVNAVAVASCYLPIAIVLIRSPTSGSLRYTIAAITTALCLWVGSTRVLLGAHFPSDVLAGLCLGSAVSAGLWHLASGTGRLAGQHGDRLAAN